MYLGHIFVSARPGPNMRICQFQAEQSVSGYGYYLFFSAGEVKPFGKQIHRPAYYIVARTLAQRTSHIAYGEAFFPT